MACQVKRVRQADREPHKPHPQLSDSLSLQSRQGSCHQADRSIWAAEASGVSSNNAGRRLGGRPAPGRPRPWRPAGWGAKRRIDVPSAMSGRAWRRSHHRSAGRRWGTGQTESTESWGPVRRRCAPGAAGRRGGEAACRAGRSSDRRHPLSAMKSQIAAVSSAALGRRRTPAIRPP